MKLNWFSPLPPARTDIANYTKRILPALKEHYEVILWTDQSKWDSEMEKEFEIRHYRFDQMPWPELNLNGLAVFNIGNNFHFHYSIWEVSQRHPGIVVLHDFRLHDFFSEIYRVIRNDREGYLEKMEFYYDQTGRKAGVDFFDGNLTIDHMNEHYPFTFLSLENALGVIVHTRKNLRELKRESILPVSYISLPYISENHFMTDRADRPPYRLILFGYLGKNRGLDQILKAIAAFEERDSFHLDIYGELWDINYIHNQIQTLGLEHLITLHGFVADARLDKALSTAHLAINLRYPDMGEASGSQLRIWNHALPSLVTKVGWYADISEQAVAFVRPDHEITDIQACLKSFLNNPYSFEKMGKKGREILKKYHNPVAYAKAIEEFTAQTGTFRSYQTVQYLTSRVSKEMNLSLSQEILNDMLKSAAEKIYEMTVSGESSR